MFSCAPPPAIQYPDCATITYYYYNNNYNYLSTVLFSCRRLRYSNILDSPLRFGLALLDGRLFVRNENKRIDFLTRQFVSAEFACVCF